MKKGKNMYLFNNYFKKHLPLFIVTIFFLGLETLADLFQPLLISKLIDQGIGNSDQELVGYYGMLMILIAGGGLISALVRNYLSTHVAFNFSKELRSGLYAHLLEMQIVDVEEIERGSIINRMTFDVKQLQQFVNGCMRIFLKAPMLAIGSFIMVLQLDRRFMYIYLAVLPIVVIIVILNLKIGYPMFAKIQVELDKLNKKTIEYLNGIRVVKAFNRSEYERDNFEHVSYLLKNVTERAMKVMAIFNPIIMLFINLAVVVALYLARSWTTGNEFGVGQIIAFVNYMTQLLFAVSILNRIFNMFIRAKISSDRIVAIFNVKLPEEQKTANLTDDDFTQGIRLEQVSFRYGNSEVAVENLNFSLRKGETLGVIGATGAGKTTLANLLVGLLKPSEGKIYIGNQPLTDNNMTQYRERVSIVPQDKILFTDTVKENIVFNQQASEVALKKAVSNASAEFIYSMKDGINTLLGKGGVNVSGGQKQRISIARAIIRNPELLILDDSTSALDAITEQKVLGNLIKSDEKPALVVISQKISTVMNLDKILVLDKGRVNGLGTHDELMKSNELYQELLNVQLGGGGEWF